MRPAPRRCCNSVPRVGGFRSLFAAKACTAERSVGRFCTIHSEISRVTWGAATLVPSMATTEPLRVPAARMPCKTTRFVSHRRDVGAGTWRNRRRRADRSGTRIFALHPVACPVAADNDGVLPRRQRIHRAAAPNGARPDVVLLLAPRRRETNIVGVVEAGLPSRQRITKRRVAALNPGFDGDCAADVFQLDQPGPASRNPRIGIRLRRRRNIDRNLRPTEAGVDVLHLVARCTQCRRRKDVARRNPRRYLACRARQPHLNSGTLLRRRQLWQPDVNGALRLVIRLDAPTQNLACASSEIELRVAS